MTITIHVGDALDVLRTLESESVHCVVTSPPYWGLRDYGTAEWEGGSAECDHRQGRPGSGRADGVVDERMQRNRDGVGSFGGDCRKCGARRVDRQLGLEPTPEEHVAKMVEVFREVRRVLRADGTAWVNYGDSYAGSWGNQGRKEERGTQRPINGPMISPVHDGRYPSKESNTGACPPGLKPKDLVGMPWRIAFALQADGWWLRSDIVWAKRNCMPESVTDRPTRSHEYVFLLAKNARYFYDADAVRESDSGQDHARTVLDGQPSLEPSGGIKPVHSGLRTVNGRDGMGRNLRSVWTIATHPFSDWGYDFAAADYVDDRGIPRKWSPGCPVHERDGQPRRSSPVEVSYGEPQGASSRCNERSGSRPAPTQPSSDETTVNCRSSTGADSPSDAPRRGKRSSSKAAPGPVQAEARKPSGTIGTQGELSLSMTGSDLPAYSETATENSSDGYRSDHDGRTSSGGTASAGSLSRTESTGPQPCGSDHEPSSDESSTNPCSDRPKSAAQSVSDRSGKYSYNDSKCLCYVSQLSHFATFPPALVEPMIKAGTSEKGCCPTCGAPWERETETSYQNPGNRTTNGARSLERRHETAGFPVRLEKSVATTGWRPTCTHGGDPVPATVLDPFFGAGTVGLVADRLGRNAIGIELNPTYAAMAEKRIRTDCPMFTEVIRK